MFAWLGERRIYSAFRLIRGGFFIQLFFSFPSLSASIVISVKNERISSRRILTRFRGARAPVSNFPNKFSRAKENDDYGDKNNNEDRNTWAPSIREAREEKHARNVIRSSSKERLRQTSRDANYAGERRRPCNRKYLLLEIAPLETTSRTLFPPTSFASFLFYFPVDK